MSTPEMERLVDEAQERMRLADHDAEMFAALRDWPAARNAEEEVWTQMNIEDALLRRIAKSSGLPLHDSL